MRAASRQSYRAALDRLDEYADTADPGALATVGEELLAVAGLLAGQPALRRALADPGREGPDRAGMLAGLLGRQVGAPTRELLDTLVAGRWSTPAELLDGCEQLGVQALLASAERDQNLAEVEDALFRFGQVVGGAPALAAAVGDRRVPATQRAGLVDALLAGKATALTVRLAKVALGGFGGRGVEAGLTRLVELAAARRDRGVAYVTAATTLTGAEEQRLSAALSARYGRDISVKIIVDPRVLGGARVQIGADLYDGTIAHRLAQARNALTR